jgi:hypothetical protein
MRRSDGEITAPEVIAPLFHDHVLYGSLGSLSSRGLSTTHELRSVQVADHEIFPVIKYVNIPPL